MPKGIYERRKTFSCVCVYCKNVFVSHIKTARFCGIKCNKKYHNEPFLIKHFICQICGKQSISHSGKTKVCDNKQCQTERLSQYRKKYKTNYKPKIKTISNVDIISTCPCCRKKHMVKMPVGKNPNNYKHDYCPKHEFYRNKSEIPNMGVMG